MSRFFSLSLVTLCLGTAYALGRQAAPAIVQPGAPGQSSKVLPSSMATLALREPSEANVSFMQGMVMHHGQAVAMTALLRTRSQNKDVQEIGRRISVSQTDEMKYMKQCSKTAASQSLCPCSRWTTAIWIVAIWQPWT